MTVAFRRHAFERMFERGFAVSDVLRIIETGETVEVNLRIPHPVRVLLGDVSGRPVHVVVADHGEEGTIVITVYEPDAVKWGSGFRKRR